MTSARTDRVSGDRRWGVRSRMATTGSAKKVISPSQVIAVCTKPSARARTPVESRGAQTCLRAPTRRQIALGRIAATHAAETAATVTRTANTLAGGSSIYSTSSRRGRHTPLHRRAAHLGRGRPGSDGPRTDRARLLTLVELGKRAPASRCRLATSRCPLGRIHGISAPLLPRARISQVCSHRLNPLGDPGVHFHGESDSAVKLLLTQRSDAS